MLWYFFFFKQKTAYEMLRSLVGSEMCIRDRFRSPFEYHSFSKQQKKDHEASAGSRAAAASASTAAGGGASSQDTPDVNSAPAFGRVSGGKRPGGTTLLRTATKAREEEPQSPQ
eukprot:TRINITY_DN39251_c0_g2_i2.p2 TRINITY_DN39251_c0_g2~~TRINITY_DN39251_c0_g2_i2.p2  ORF type:complete len:114 (+),score=46.98 TRINITY_DN39251_c0_g2_i2:32-373(+)